MQNRNNHGFWHGFNITAVILIILFAIALPLFLAFAQYTQSVDIQASQTTSSHAYIPTSFTIDITNANRTPLNAIEFELTYDPQRVLITAIVPHDTLCEERFVITNSFNNASGTALFQCGTVHPFSDENGTLATVHVLPLISGTSSVAFGPLTHVLAHDGYGTDATRTRTDLIFSAI